MKKKYEKPVVIFEDMELNTSIATCEYQELPGGQGIESHRLTGAILFTLGDSNMKCDVSGDTEDFYCYHNPTLTAGVLAVKS